MSSRAFGELRISRFSRIPSSTLNIQFLQPQEDDLSRLKRLMSMTASSLPRAASRPLTINVVLPIWRVSSSLLHVFLVLCPSSAPISSSYPFLPRFPLGLHAMVPNANEPGHTVRAAGQSILV